MKKITLFAFLLASPLVFSQRNLTIQEATSGAYTSFAPKQFVAPQFRGENAITYLESTYQNLVQRSKTDKWSEKALMSKNDIIEALKEKIKDDEFQLYIFPYDYTWKTADIIAFNVEGAKQKYYVELDANTKKITKAIPYKSQGKNETLTSKGNYLAWLEDNNIFLTDENGKTLQITNDKEGIVNGSDYTHRQEFGIDKGMWFSEDGNNLLYYRKDESMVTDYPLIDFASRVAEVKDIKYPMAGMKSEEVTLVVYNIATGKKVSLQTGEPKEQFLTMVTWDPSNEFVYVGVLNRGQDHLKLNKYKAADGSFVTTLFEQKSKTYVEPSHPLFFNPNNPKEFIYVTDIDGYRQMYLYNTSGKLVRKLGYNQVVFKELSGFDKQHVYYLGTANKGLDKQLYQVNLKNGKTQKLTDVTGTHTVAFNDSKTAFYDQYSNTAVPRVVNIVDVKSRKKEELLKAENPYEGKVTLPKMEMVTIKSADGKTDLNGRLIYPSDFDAAKKYPVMVYVYGGPHAQLVTNTWLGGASLFDFYMAQQGFVVFTLDNRGSDNRGRDFEHIVHRKLGQAEMADQMKGIDFLKSKSFVDKDKIGVYGWSFGGFMTTSLMLNHPETFKVGVAGGPVIDWKWYEVMYGERYMDTPEENPEGYKLTSTLDKVSNLQGRLLMIHGAQDPVVVQQHSMEFIEACIKAGKQVDYFLYPTHEHNVSGKDRIHLNAKIADYFMTHLKK
ncbi:DPP IV N-terminal domain-containing protein [Paenimyroides ceti]